jgi:hypothetical protein
MITSMTQRSLLLLPFLIALPALAQETAPAAPVTPEAEEGFDLIEEGAKIILRSLLDDVQPKVKELQDGFAEALAEMEPAIRDLLSKIDDFRNYHPPEIQPNGDIIIRRKTPAEIAEPQGEIEL